MNRRKFIWGMYTLLLLAMCFVMVSCEFGSAHQHIFEWKNDNEFHWSICSCGELNGEKSKHLYSDTFLCDSSGHWKVCICGAAEDKEKHSRSDLYSDSASHWYICTICDLEMDKESHSANYNNDETSHWFNCGICKFETDKQSHSFNYESDDKYHWNKCVCGKQQDSIKHSFENYLFTSEEHWQECVCGQRSELLKHSGKWQISVRPTDAKDGEKVKICNECEFVNEQIIKKGTIIIETLANLTNMIANNSPTAKFELANDIDGEGQTWLPIDIFRGTLIGNGYSIKNLKINKVSGLSDNTAYSGFFYKNEGVIKNIYFKNITIDAFFEYQTSDKRYVNVGAVVAANYGEINNVHLENVTVKSKLGHRNDESNFDVKQVNVTGGIVGKNCGTISFCSIRKSSVTSSTDAKYNCCDTAVWAGGICGENIKNCNNLLSAATTVSTNTRGGYDRPNWFDNSSDGDFYCYGGSIIGIILVNTNNSKMISYNNELPQASIYVIAGNNTKCSKNIGKIYGVNNYSVTESYDISNVTDFDSYSPIIATWSDWSVSDAGPENYKEM